MSRMDRQAYAKTLEADLTQLQQAEKSARISAGTDIFKWSGLWKIVTDPQILRGCQKKGNGHGDPVGCEKKVETLQKKYFAWIWRHCFLQQKRLCPFLEELAGRLALEYTRAMETAKRKKRIVLCRY